jgi:quercetin dioxygenase-like cupin family protein
VSREALHIFDDLFPPQNIRHHFAGQDDDHGVYAKEMLIDAGTVLTSHVHAYDHLSIIGRGIAHLQIEAGTRVVVGPQAIVIPKGAAHELRAITDVVWYCIHATSDGEV